MEKQKKKSKFLKVLVVFTITVLLVSFATVTAFAVSAEQQFQYSFSYKDLYEYTKPSLEVTENTNYSYFGTAANILNLSSVGYPNGWGSSFYGIPSLNKGSNVTFNFDTRFMPNFDIKKNDYVVWSVPFYTSSPVRVFFSEVTLTIYDPNDVSTKMEWTVPLDMKHVGSQNVWTQNIVFDGYSQFDFKGVIAFDVTFRTGGLAIAIPDNTAYGFGFYNDVLVYSGDVNNAPIYSKPNTDVTDDYIQTEQDLFNKTQSGLIEADSILNSLSNLFSTDSSVFKGLFAAAYLIDIVLTIDILGSLTTVSLGIGMIAFILGSSYIVFSKLGSAAGNGRSNNKKGG